MGDNDVVCKGCWLFKNACGICSKCRKAAFEFADLAHWRNCRDEKPTKAGEYLTYWVHDQSMHIVAFDPTEETKWMSGVSPDYWRPIGSMPGE